MELDQGPFDCILHKLPGEDWKKQLNDYTLRYPDVFIIDKPEAIERLHNRISMLQVVSELSIIKQEDEDETYGIPKQTVVYKAEALSDCETLAGLNFPVIAKPLVADGSVKSHKMSLVYNSEGLLKLKPPLVLQEFVNHGGVIFKVYVVGDYVKCVKRKSLPDVPEEKLGSSEGPMPFCHVSNVTQDHKNEMYYEVMQLEDAELPPARFVAKIAGSLRRALGLHLFNFDVIRDTKISSGIFFMTRRGWRAMELKMGTLWGKPCSKQTNLQKKHWSKQRIFQTSVMKDFLTLILIAMRLPNKKDCISAGTSDQVEGMT
ncbi:hypothetical protein SUGI_1027920 [Cryptomeria japonica]|nr:hypothetical protein SUGI_1027920 [Cryptomeria japonica]